MHDPTGTTATLRIGDATFARVDALHVDEAVSRPFRAEVEFSAVPTDPATLRGAVAAVEVVQPGGRVRYLAGVVDEATVSLQPALREGERVRHRVVIVPAPYGSLRYRHGFRIFQDQTALDIVRALLREGGVEEARVTVDVARSLPVRPYCVQYDASDWDFVARLLEDEGVLYTFLHDADGWRMLLLDRSADAPRATPYTLPFLAEADPESPTAVAWLGAARVKLTETAVRVDDYDPTRPALDLAAEAEAEGPVPRRAYHWGGTQLDPAANKRAAQQRLDALRAARSVLTLRSNALTVQPGQRVEVTQHPSAEATQFVTAMRWSLRVEATHEAGARAMHVELDTAPASHPWEPPRVTPKPRVMGMQTARVTGPAGREVYTDALGRVKVQFHWDREGVYDARASCWLRVAQGHTTGSVAIPRIGWEVLVEFVDGDPDRPLCMGKLWHPQHTPHIALPAGRTQSSFSSVSSPGGAGVNSVVFEDQSGAEEIAVTGSYDLSMVTARNKLVTVGNASTAMVAVDRKVTVGGDDNAAVLSNHALRGGADESHTVGGSRTRRTSGSMTETVGGAFTMQVGAMETMQVGSAAAAMLQVIGSEVVEASVGAAATAASRAQGALLGPIAPALSRAGEALGRASHLAGPAGALLTGGDPGRTLYGGALDALTANPGALDAAGAASNLTRAMVENALNPSPQAPAPGGAGGGAGGGGAAGGPAGATGGGSGTWATVVGGAVTETIGGAQVLNAAAGLSVTVGGSVTESIGAASVTLAGGGISETTGGSKLETVGVYRVDAKTSAALTAGAAMAFNVAGSERRVVKGTHSIAATGPLVVNTPTLKLTASGTITLACGACKVILHSGGISIEGAASLTFKGGVVTLDENVLGT